MSDNEAISPAISPKAKAFVLIAAVLGFFELASLGVHWHTADLRRFLIYLLLTSACSLVNIKRADQAGGFSLNVPFLLLGIIDLSTPEAVALGCVAVAIQHLRTSEHWYPRRLLVTIAVQATVIASASFMFHSVLPEWFRISPIRLFLAALALFFANTFPAAILRRLNGEQRLGELWRSTYFWSFPFYLVAAALAQVIRQGGNAVTSSSSFLALIAMYLAYRHYRAQKAEWQIRAKHAADLAALHLRAIEGLALAVEAKDNLNTRGHLRRVQVYALGIGKSMGLHGPELEALQAGSLLHDIGKLAVPEHILTKPGKLTPEEFAKMKVHPLVGAEIVEQMKFPYPVAPIVRAHHEKFDGSGYPYGLKGEDIPLGARILSVADFLDAMVSDREYRKGIPLDDAMQLIVAESGKSFDPAVVEALQKQYQSLAKSAIKQASEGPVDFTESVVANHSTPGAGLDMCGLPEGTRDADFLSAISDAGREQQLLSAMAEAATSLDPIETMRRMELALRDRLPHDALAFFVPEANVLRAEFAAGKQREMLAKLEIPLGEGLIGWVGQNLQTVVNGNPAVDPGFFTGPTDPLESVLAVPLTSKQGLVCVLALYRAKPDSFTRREAQILKAVQQHIAAAIKNAFTYREAEMRANYDHLTGFLNRTPFLRVLDEELAKAHRTKQPVALILSELLPSRAADRDHGSHDVLAAVSRAFRQASREDDQLGRLGPNRFAILLPRVKAVNVVTILNRIREATQSSSIAALGHALELKSAGAFYPDDGEGGRHLLSVVEQRLEGTQERWEESLRALILASEAEAGTRPVSDPVEAVTEP